MASGRLSAGRRNYVDLTSDNDGPPPPKPKSRNKGKMPDIDLGTPPPKPSKISSLNFQPALIIGRPVKLSSPSAPRQNHSPDPPKNMQNFLTKSQDAVRRAFEASKPTNAASPLEDIRDPSSPVSVLIQHTSPIRDRPKPAISIAINSSSSSKSPVPDPIHQADPKSEAPVGPRDDIRGEDKDEEDNNEDLDHRGDNAEDQDAEIEDVYRSHSLATDVGIPARQSDHRDHGPDPDISSIGSTSPLLIRLRQQRVTKDVNQTEKLRLFDLEKRLRECLKDMRAQHALSTRYILEEAREAALASSNDLACDRNSPWASMKSVAFDPKVVVLLNPTIDIMHHHVTLKNGKISRGKSKVSVTKAYGNTPRVPRYNSHTSIRRNILKADDENLKFIPFFGESRNENNHRKLLKELEQVYTPLSKETSRESEENSRIREFLPCWLAELQLACDTTTLKHYLLVQEKENGELGLSLRLRRLLLESFESPLTHEKSEIARRFSEVFEKVFRISLGDVILPPGLLKEMIEVARNKAAKKEHGPSNRIATYTDLTCLICAAIDCPIHGDFIHERVDSSDLEDDEHSAEMKYELKGLVLPYEDTVRQYKNRVKENIKPLPPSEAQPCLQECYMVTDFSDLDYEFHEDHLSYLPQMISTYRHPNYRSCYIAFALNIPCWTVYAEIQRYESEVHEEVAEYILPGPAKKPEWYDNKRKILKGDLNDLTSAHLHQERGQAVVCGHAGPCIVRPGGDSCPCAATDILCESFCGCSDDCPRSFTGCSCLAFGLACSTDSCICIQMNRECGPQCGTCGASERTNPANRYDYDLFITGCQNVYLQRDVAKATVMGESQLVGFGLYLAEPVKKGDYIDEYVGENISNEEAERRGIVYERKQVSFLFDLNAERTIDAARLGNKTRFINHSSSSADGLNIEAKIVLVNGEHRIKFVALRDIAIGEELLFNYGKKFADKQGLNATLPKAQAGSKRGVLEGEEALDALDGMDQRKKGSREKINAIRGGAKPGDKKSGSKMRKTAAPMAEVVREVPEDEADAEDDSVDRPRRRKIMRPTRYTR
ncbi:uncharacterized protein RAG0_06659 [Rhynchosporium agropyri]|uniref:Polycomb group protein MEDEA n=1 Tax=Rhynchosporium agropyri TaxID=914238 RepID=A0A1E1KI85_9HELO|nr:uncharacterized protein RAG0_06659 [Rhynchosporium agropyri]